MGLYWHCLSEVKPSTCSRFGPVTSFAFVLWGEESRLAVPQNPLLAVAAQAAAPRLTVTSQVSAEPPSANAIQSVIAQLRALGLGSEKASQRHCARTTKHLAS